MSGRGWKWPDEDPVRTLLRVDGGVSKTIAAYYRFKEDFPGADFWAQSWRAVSEYRGERSWRGMEVEEMEAIIRTAWALDSGKYKVKEGGKG